MKTEKKNRSIRSLAGVVAAVFLYFCSGISVPVLDTAADDYFNEAITKAGIAYATCRVVNASVSIVKDSSLQLQPAGVGISLAVGQALDPIDDMTERLSDVLVTAITSLGIQKLVYEIGVSLAPQIFAIFLFILSVLSWFENDRLATLQKMLLRFMLLIFVARFCLPISAVSDAYLHKHFFAEQISAAENGLLASSAELDKLKDFSLPEIDGLLGTIENSASFLKRKSIEFKNALAATVSNTGIIVESLLKLTFLYVGIILIQVIILPLLSFWFLVKMANAILYTDKATNAGRYESQA